MEVRKVNQRFSRKREAIYACLCATRQHPSADWIHQQLRPQFPDLSLATVYRNLSQLKDAGLIQSVGVVDGQERFDADLRPHSHFVCTACHLVQDLEIQLPEDLIAQAEAATGCTVTGTSLRLTGLCPKCRRVVS